MPCQKVDFSAVKEVQFLPDDYYNQDNASISNEFISHIFRSSDNLEKVIFDESLDDFNTNTRNLLVIPTHRKLKSLSMIVTSPDQTLSHLLSVLTGLAEKVELETKRCKLDLNISYQTNKSQLVCDKNFEVQEFEIKGGIETHLCLKDRISGCIFDVYMLE